MPPTLGAVKVNPAGQSLSVDITSEDGPRPTVYTAANGSTTFSLPTTVNADTTFYFTQKGNFFLSAKLSGTEIASGSSTTQAFEIQPNTNIVIVAQIDLSELLGLAVTGGTGAALKANNLSDLASAATARTNLGLGTAATKDAGVASGVATLDANGKVAQLRPSYTDVLATDVGLFSPSYATIQTGVFIPDANGAVDVTVNTDGTLAGASPVILNFLYGIVSPETPRALRTTGVDSPPASGVTRAYVGRLSASAVAIGAMTRTMHLTGLTPNGRYTWALQSAVVSGFQSISVTGNPAAGVVLPNNTKAYFVSGPPDRLVPVNIGGRPAWNLLDQNILSAIGTPITVGALPTCPAATPNSTRVVVPNFTASTASIVNTATDAVTFTTAASLPGAFGCACPDNTTAWVSTNTDGKVYPVTIASGAVGTAYSVHAGVTYMTTDGTNLFVIANDNKIYKVKISDGTLTASAALSPAPARLCMSSDNASVWVVTNTASKLIQLAVSDMSTTQSITLTYASTTTGVAASSDGRCVWVTHSDGHTEQIMVNSEADPVNNVYAVGLQAAAVNGIAVTSDEYIFLPINNATILEYPGATLSVKPNTTPQLNAEFSEVTFVGATKG